MRCCMRKRILILFLVAVIFLSMVVELPHDCIGNGCPVCALMRLCRSVLLSLCALILLPGGFEGFAALKKYRLFRSPGATPVSLKVKLSD